MVTSSRNFLSCSCTFSNSSPPIDVLGIEIATMSVMGPEGGVVMGIVVAEQCRACLGIEMLKRVLDAARIVRRRHGPNRDNRAIV